MTDTTRPYRVIGTTYDGVKVLAPKMKSRRFTASQIRRAIRRALQARQA